MKVYGRKLFLLILDTEIVNLTLFLAMLFRFDGDIPSRYMNLFTNTFLLLTLVQITIYFLTGLYSSLWRYASIDELVQIFTAVSAAVVVEYALGCLMGMRFPRSVYLISWLLNLLFVGGSRLSYRLLRRAKNIMLVSRDDSDIKRIMVIGAGEAGSMIIKEMKSHKSLRYNIVAVIDDDRKKHRSSIHGVPVRGGQESIKEVAEKHNVDEIVVAIPSATRKETYRILNICKETRCKLRILPGVYDLSGNKVSLDNIRDVRLEDLLGRDEIQLTTSEIFEYIKGETVLVTGGGGSIGSELCRQLAKFHPKRLLVLDIYENNAYDLQNELIQRYGDQLELEVIIASVRDREKLRSVFAKYRPGVVFHAAAHKHVPLMEANPDEAVKNNVFGTLNTALCADESGTKKFVLVSTDKAVNPTNIMGATKRLAEMIVQSLDKQSRTEFVAVRFGNVLGSNGSVVPLFKKQIAHGGPVTVTHPEITRFFMTIQEAAQLVIQAGAIAKGGEIFILDMGKQVRIADLARDMIKLSGFEPDVDIKIEFSGLRPGEKLYEELLMDEEGIMETRHEKLFIGKPAEMSFSEVLMCIKTLENSQNDPEVVREKMKSIVSTYAYECAVEEIAASK